MVACVFAVVACCVEQRVLLLYFLSSFFPSACVLNVVYLFYLLNSDVYVLFV
jgi:hypothetical protein